MEASNKAVNFDPKLQLSWSSLGYVYLSAGNKSKAEESFNKAVGLLREQLKIYPEDAMAGLNLSDVYVGLEKYDDALKCCQKSIALNPNFTFAWERLGGIYYQMKNYSESLKALNKAVELAPNDANIREARDAVATYVQ